MWLWQPLAEGAQLLAGAGTQSLTPSLVTNSQTFYAPTVAATYVLTPDLFTNGQTFYSPTVSLGGTQDLTPSLVTNSQTFYAPTVTALATIAPDLFTNSQTFYGPTVTASYTLEPGLFSNTQTFYAATVVSATVAGAGIIDGAGSGKYREEDAWAYVEWLKEQFHKPVEQEPEFADELPKPTAPAYIETPIFQPNIEQIFEQLTVARAMGESLRQHQALIAQLQVELAERDDEEALLLLI